MIIDMHSCHSISLGREVSTWLGFRWYSSIDEREAVALFGEFGCYAAWLDPIGLCQCLPFIYTRMSHAYLVGFRRSRDGDDQLDCGAVLCSGVCLLTSAFVPPPWRQRNRMLRSLILGQIGYREGVRVVLYGTGFRCVGVKPMSVEQRPLHSRVV